MLWWLPQNQCVLCSDSIHNRNNVNKLNFFFTGDALSLGIAKERRHSLADTLADASLARAQAQAGMADFPGNSPSEKIKKMV